MKFEFKISLRDAQKAQEIMNDSPTLRKRLNAIATDTYRTDSDEAADEFYHTLLGDGVEFTSNFDANDDNFAGKGALMKFTNAANAWFIRNSKTNGRNLDGSPMLKKRFVIFVNSPKSSMGEQVDKASAITELSAEAFSMITGQKDDPRLVYDFLISNTEPLTANDINSILEEEEVYVVNQNGGISFPSDEDDDDMAGKGKKTGGLIPLAEQFEEVLFEMNDGNDPPLSRLTVAGVAEQLVDIHEMSKIKAHKTATELLPLILLQRVERYMKNFPDNATSWRDATDEMRDLSRIVRQTGYNELTLDVLEDDPRANPGLDFRVIKTPAEWNRKAKAFIRDLWPQLSAQGQRYVVEYVDQQLAANPQFAGKGAKTPYSKPEGSVDVIVITEGEIAEIKSLAKKHGGVFIFKQRAGAYYSLSFNFTSEDQAQEFKREAWRMRDVSDVMIELSAGHGAHTGRKKYSREMLDVTNNLDIAALYKREFGADIDAESISVEKARAALADVPFYPETITISDTVTSHFFELRGKTFPVKEIKTFFMASGPVEEYLVDRGNGDGEVWVPESMVVKTAPPINRRREAKVGDVVTNRINEATHRIVKIEPGHFVVANKKDTLSLPFNWYNQTQFWHAHPDDVALYEEREGRDDMAGKGKKTGALNVNFDHGAERYYLRVGNIINEMHAGTVSYRYEILGFRRDGDGQIAATVREKTTTKGRPAVNFTISLSDIRAKMGDEYVIQEVFSREIADAPFSKDAPRDKALLAAECEIIEMQIVCEEVKKQLQKDAEDWAKASDRAEAQIEALQLENRILEETNARLEDEADKVVNTASELKADMDATLAAALPADDDSFGVSDSDLYEGAKHIGYTKTRWNFESKLPAKTPLNLKRISQTTVNGDTTVVRDYLDHLPLYDLDEVPKYNPSGSMANPEFKREGRTTNYLIQNSDGEYFFVDTQGYDYPRYITALPWYKRGDDDFSSDGDDDDSEALVGSITFGAVRASAGRQYKNAVIERVFDAVPGGIATFRAEAERAGLDPQSLRDAADRILDSIPDRKLSNVDWQDSHKVLFGILKAIASQAPQGPGGVPVKTIGYDEIRSWGGNQYDDATIDAIVKAYPRGLAGMLKDSVLGGEWEEQEEEEDEKWATAEAMTQKVDKEKLGLQNMQIRDVMYGFINAFENARNAGFGTFIAGAATGAAAVALAKTGLGQRTIARAKSKLAGKGSQAAPHTPIKESDIVKGKRFALDNGDGTVFIIDDVYKAEGWGTAVETSLEGGVKGNYKDSIEEVVAFLNEENAVLLSDTAGKGGMFLSSAEYSKIRKTDKAKSYQWDSDTQLYKKVDSTTPPRRPGRARWTVRATDGLDYIVESVMRPRKYQTKTDVINGKKITITKTLGRHKE